MDPLVVKSLDTSLMHYELCLKESKGFYYRYQLAARLISHGCLTIMIASRARTGSIPLVSVLILLNSYVPQLVRTHLINSIHLIHSL